MYMDLPINENTKEKTFGFIISRHVNSPLTNKYWIECCLCIRKYYKENWIIIIDGNSDYNYVNSFNIEINNLRVIKSEYPNSGEFSPFIYYIREKYFDTAVIIHDSIFVNSYIDFNIDLFAVFWDFHKCNDKGLLPLIDDILSVFEDKDELISLYHKRDRVSIFGSNVVITHDALMKVNEKYNFDLLIPKMQNKAQRCCLERVLPILLYKTFPDHSFKLYFGDILKYMQFGVRYSCYENNRLNHLPLIKVWTFR